jgi:hypothetical protein
MKKVIYIFVLLFIFNGTITAQTKSEPTLQETFSWIRNKCLSFCTDGFDSHLGLGKPTDIVIDESKHLLTFVNSEKSPSGSDLTYCYSIYFSNLNGNSLTWSENFSEIILNVSSKSGTVASWGYYRDGYGDGKKATARIAFNKSLFSGDNMKDRMTKAFTQAIVLSGGQFEEEKF